MKNTFLFLTVCLFVAGCGGVKTLTPEEEARLNARDALVRAGKVIKTCEEEEVDAGNAGEMLLEANEAFENRDYLRAKEKADAAYRIAKNALDEARAARKKAMEEAEKELSKRRPASYTVGSWAKNRDCLWNIAKKPEIYNDAWQWKKIYLANKNKIKDPDLIYPKQVFKIPR